MAINLSTGMRQAILNSSHNTKKEYIASDISLGDGDGAGGLDTINAPAGLDVFPVGAWVQVVTPEGDPNRDKRVKVLTSSASKLEVAAGSFTAFAAGTLMRVTWHDICGSIRSLFENCVAYGFAQDRPNSADDAEPGSPIAIFTLNAAAFSAGSPENGLNFGEVDGDYMRRAIDPATGASEVWRANPISGLYMHSMRFYANNVIQGASTNSIRFDAICVDKGQTGDVILNNGPQLTVDVPVDITSVKVQVSGASVI